MDVLDRAVLLFRNASELYPNALIPFAETILGAYVLLAFTLLTMSLVFHHDLWGLAPRLLGFLLLAGIAHVGVLHGYEMSAALFDGTKTLGKYITGSEISPSAIVQMGAVAADPIMKSIAAQGWLSFAKSPIITSVYGLSGLAVQFSYVVLAGILVSLLVLSYVLVASAPFFLAWLALSFTASLALLWVRLVLGTMAALFITVLLCAMSMEVGELLAAEFTAHFTQPGATFTASDYLLPLVVSAILILLWSFIPYRFATAVASFVPSWGGGLQLAGMGMAAINGGGQALASGTATIQSRMSGGGQQQVGNGGQRSEGLAYDPYVGGTARQGQRSGNWGRK